MYDLRDISEAEVSECGAALSELGAGSGSMEETANRIVRCLYDQLGAGVSGERACALVRFYKTHAYGGLPPDLQAFANGILGDEAGSDDMKCLTLLATVGQNAKWTSRANSEGHKAIPLPSEDFVGRIPMISRLVTQLGLELGQLLRPDPTILLDLHERTYNVFHVDEAVGSPYIPAQADFVIPYGVRSVLGFGGILETGDLYAVILFSKALISRAVAERFKPLALKVREAVAPLAGEAVFA
jgi:hypothetical protein